MLFMQETIQIVVIKAVNTINNIDIPSIPSLNFIKLFIQECSYINWNYGVVWSNECQTKSVRKNVAKLLNRAIYLELLSFFWFLDKKINIALINGKKIKVDKIGKFILV